MINKKTGPISVEDIENFVELFDRSDWDEMHLQVDGLEIFLSNDPHARAPEHGAPVAAGQPAPAPTPAATRVAVPAAAVPDGMVGVRAPNLGTFYRAPKPGVAAYVEIGQRVTEDTEVCLIEVMKLFTPVRAGVRGTVLEICVADAEMVEFDQLLVIIEPAG